jgi:hypothetical protein
VLSSAGAPQRPHSVSAFSLLPLFVFVPRAGHAEIQLPPLQIDAHHDDAHLVAQPEAAAGAVPIRLCAASARGDPGGGFLARRRGLLARPP